MIIKGELMLAFSSIKSLGKIKEINGDLWLQSSSIVSLPKGLKVNGSINLSNTKIDKEYLKNNFPEIITKSKLLP
jgi:hypothetical protein